jgi:hypothetical protein
MPGAVEGKSQLILALFMTMHITILALGSRGDVQPYAVLGSGLKSAGHQVRFK